MLRFVFQRALFLLNWLLGVLKTVLSATASSHLYHLKPNVTWLFGARRRLTLIGATLIVVWAASTLFSSFHVAKLDSVLTVSKWEKFMTALDHASKPVGCVSWRATDQCSPYGHRAPTADTSCRSLVQFTSGYCECEHSVLVALVGCGMHAFTCFDRCRELGSQGRQMPELMQCKPQRSSQGSGNGTGSQPGVPKGNGTYVDMPLENITTDNSPEVWEALVGPVRAHNPKPKQLLVKRTEDDDWLREGGRMAPELIAGLRGSLQSYMTELSLHSANGGLPPSTQHGRGIVMVSGGLRFMVSAWIGLAMLRRAGSTLPVEMWFPVLEYPTGALVEVLRQRGVTCRSFAVADLDQAGYSLKVAAIMLSGFAEVLFLDADNFPLQDPAQLFETPEYVRTGSIFWKDYWFPTAVPELAAILGVPRKDLPDSTFEAGQMLIDKRKHWRGLRVALYFNYYHEVFYDLFTDYMGWGDKETFYYAFLAAREPVYYVPFPTGSVGIVRPFCRRFKSRQLCREVFTGNSMVQYGIDGKPFFLHANLEKWSLRMPDSFHDYTRRWQTLQPGGEAFTVWSERMLGLDLELFIYNQVRSFRCAPFFGEYYEVRRRHGDRPIPALDGLHNLMPGIEFHQMYRLGHRGTYSNLFEHSTLDEVLYTVGVSSRTGLMRLKQCLLCFWGGRKVARLLFHIERRLRNTLLSYSM